MISTSNNSSFFQAGDTLLVASVLLSALSGVVAPPHWPPMSFELEAPLLHCWLGGLTSLLLGPELHWLITGDDSWVPQEEEPTSLFVPVGVPH